MYLPLKYVDIMMKRRKRIDHLNGKGTITLDNGTVNNIYYDLSIFQDVFTSRPGESELKGLIDIQGNISLIDENNYISAGEYFILRMEDGSEIRAFVSNITIGTNKYQIALNDAKDFCKRYD